MRNSIVWGVFLIGAIFLLPARVFALPGLAPSFATARREAAAGEVTTRKGLFGRTIIKTYVYTDHPTVWAKLHSFVASRPTSALVDKTKLRTGAMVWDETRPSESLSLVDVYVARQLAAPELGGYSGELPEGAFTLTASHAAADGAQGYLRRRARWRTFSAVVSAAGLASGFVLGMPAMPLGVPLVLVGARSVVGVGELIAAHRDWRRARDIPAVVASGHLVMNRRHGDFVQPTSAAATRDEEGETSLRSGSPLSRDDAPRQVMPVSWAQVAPTRFVPTAAYAY